MKCDAISDKEMKKRYGDKNVKYAIATKLAMKEFIYFIFYW